MTTQVFSKPFTQQEAIPEAGIARAVEIMKTGRLHRYNLLPDEAGEAEYKSTIQPSINGTYNGISVQPTWEEQELYLIEQKIGKYKHHYFARYSDAKIVELYVLEAADVLAILLPKLKKQYERFQILSPKDPRLGATVTKTEIYKYGRKLIG